MNRLLPLIAALWLAAPAAAEQTVVVELFTSQGCSSCPPADRILGELAKRDDVIALALHVDYWDYLGWKDEFADPTHTQRQRAYSRAAGQRTIYTPQMVIGGVDHVIGSKPMKISDLVRKHAAKTAPVKVAATRQGDTIKIEALGKGRAALVQVVTYTPEATVKIRRGENAGQTFTYHNIVRNIEVLGKWDGKGAYRANARVPKGVPAVILVQARDGGVILGAARLR
ncbi:MAG: DUF1223 domain-containing protein [Silicimonas sp.]|nr:DUF1223 domain-containing protein [Silicimonas sp.]